MTLVLFLSVKNKQASKNNKTTDFVGYLYWNFVVTGINVQGILCICPLIRFFKHNVEGFSCRFKGALLWCYFVGWILMKDDINEKKNAKNQ